MKRFFKILGWVLGGFALAAAAAAGGLYLWLLTSLPLASGAVTLPGLAGPAEISRDADGLVHIRANSANDAYFSLGYAHAQDRLWQMEATRRLGTGRLAEIAGGTFLAQDRLMRTLGLGRLAEAALVRLSPEARAVVEAYARGVNAWIDNHRGALPPEFTLLRHAPEPWRPADCLIWGRLMALRLSGNWRRQLTRARLLAHLPAEAIERLYPPDPENAPVTVADRPRAEAPPHPFLARPDPTRRAAAGPEAPQREVPQRLLDALRRVLPQAPAADGASNGWLVTGARSASGKPLLANDPHLGFRAPNLWYLARIEAPGLTIAGATAPGVPFHVLGHNGRIAWGMATTGADTQDLVIERLAPDGSNRYLAPDGPRAFAWREEVIRVRGAAAVSLSVRESRNGPIVSDLSGGDAAAARSAANPTEGGDAAAAQSAANPTEGGSAAAAQSAANPTEGGSAAAGPGAVLALRSPVLAVDDTTAEALFRINHATDWDSFTAALERFHAPVQNLFYADTAGHIGFSVAGRVPVRRGRDSRALADGARGADDWAGYVPPALLPRSFDPARGIIVNANNRVAGPAYPYDLARDWEPPYRAMRIEQLLARPGPQDPVRAGAFQLDAVSLAARDLVPVLLRLTPRGADDGALLDRLRTWDGRADRERPEALIFTAWMARLSAVLFRDELGPTYEDFARIRPRLLLKVLTEDTSWCDDVTTAERRETCPEALAAALAEAHAGLGRSYGPDPAAWRWGASHRAIFRNAALDWLPLLGPRTRVTIETDGDDFTLNRGTSRVRRGASAFTHVHGATLRTIYDLADLDGALFAMPGGQSGNPLSSHYRDLTRPWRDGRYLRLPARPAGPLATLRLLPDGTKPPRP